MVYYGKELYHYGIKGQKRGIRRYQNLDGTYTELGKERRRKGHRYDVWLGHDSTPKIYKRNAILDHIKKDGMIKTRTYYDENGLKKLEIHTGDHGHSKTYPKGAHVHEYTWSAKGIFVKRLTRELTDEEIERNKDIIYEGTNNKKST